MSKHGFDQSQISFIKQLMTNRNKELRHEVSDHLDNALPAAKIKGGVAGQTIVTNAAGTSEWATPTTGVTDHGLLSGLADDDHTQYHNDARGDARYQPLDADLTTIAALDSGTSTGVMATEAAGWVKRTYAQVKTSLGLVKADVGLGNVDNTSDANKPVSTAQQTALDLKAPITSPTFLTSAFAPTVAIGAGTNIATIGAVNTALGAYLTTSSAASTYAPLASPALTGTPTVPTAATATNTTQAASTAFVKAQRMSDLTLPNASVPMNSNKFTGLAAGSANGDSLRYEQLFTTGTVSLLGSVAVPDSKVVNVGTSLTGYLGMGVAGAYQSGDSYPRSSIDSSSKLLLGAGTATPDWQLSRTAANEATIAAGDVLKHDTAAENSANTVVATTAYVDRATGSASSNRPAVGLTAPLISGAAQHATSGSELTIDNWQTESYDTDSMHSASSNQGRITLGTTGTYIFKAHVRFTAAATTGTTYLGLKKNGSVIVYADPIPWVNSGTVSSGCTLIHEDQGVAGDYYEIIVFQNTGATRTFAGTSYFQAVWVGGTGAAWGNAGAKATQGTNTLMTTGTLTEMLFSTEEFDIDGMHSTSSATGRLTCVTPGTYIVTGQIVFETTSTTGYRSAFLRKNGTDIGGHTADAEDAGLNYAHVPVSAVVQMVAGDYVQLYGQQNSGGSVNSGISGTWLSAVRVGYQTNPQKNGQFIGRVTATADGNTGSIATGTTSIKFLASDLSITGDGVNYIKLELNLYGPYISAGTTGHWDAIIYDESASAVKSMCQLYVTATGVSMGGRKFEAYIAPFTGTKNFNFRFKNNTGGNSTMTNQAGSTYPTYLTAWWAGSSGHA